MEKLDVEWKILQDCRWRSSDVCCSCNLTWYSVTWYHSSWSDLIWKNLSKPMTWIMSFSSGFVFHFHCDIVISSVCLQCADSIFVLAYVTCFMIVSGQPCFSNIIKLIMVLIILYLCESMILEWLDNIIVCFNNITISMPTNRFKPFHWISSNRFKPLTMNTSKKK